MIDPGTALTIATEGAGLLLKVVRVLKRVAEGVKNVRKDLRGLLRRSERMRGVFMLLQRLILALKETKDSDLVLDIDETECRETLDELDELANEIGKTTQSSVLLGGVQWAGKKNKVERLTKKLSEQENDIMNVVLLIGTYTTVRTHQSMSDLQQAVGNPGLQNAFQGLKVVEDTTQASHTHERGPRRLRTWLGHTLTDSFPEAYLVHRTNLSEAAFFGRWDGIWEMLQTGEDKYGESWINAVRMKPQSQSDQMSFWTPLHQAVYHRAPIEVVRRLLDLGASRLLRSHYTSYASMDMSALELAHEFNFGYLYEILSPVIRQPVPFHTLTALQARFHSLIRHDLGARVDQEKIFLPLLEVLTEYQNDIMWFPVRFKHKAGGYAFRLDGRELVVKSCNISAADVVQEYRITADETRAVDEALIISQFNTET